MDNLDLNRLHQKVSLLLNPANQIASDYFYKGTKTLYKNVSSTTTYKSVVTKADIEVEDFFKTKLKKLYPDFGFVGEEGHKSEIKEYNWIIDPIDGTLNFVWGVPLFCHSIALWKENQPIYGLVSLPLLDQTYYAIKGQGFFSQGKRVKRQASENTNPFAVYGFGGSSKERTKALKGLSDVIPFTRQFGSTVYHGVLVSLGEVELALIVNNALWDVGAIVLFGQEVGLDIKWISSKPNIYDKDLKKYQYSLVMGEKELVDKVASELKKLK